MEAVEPPMGNRVEDLEKQVAELQAAVDGLTEELVESKERLRQLENGGSVESTADDGAERNVEFGPNESASQPSSASESDDETETAADDGESEEANDDDSDGIIVA